MYFYYSINDIVALCRTLFVKWLNWLCGLIPFWLLPSWVYCVVRVPTLVYFLYFQVPYTIATSCWTFVTAVVFAVARRNTPTRQMTIQISTMGTSLLQFWECLINIKLSELLLTVLLSIFEVIKPLVHKHNRASYHGCTPQTLNNKP